MDSNIPKLEKQKLIQNFNQAAQGYGDISVLQNYTGKELLDRLSVIRLEVETIIDLGSGPGSLSKELSEKYKSARIIQMDIAENMLRTARTVGAPRQFYVCADAEALPLDANSVDLVFSNLMLQWVPDPGRLLRDVAHCLRPGGLFIFATLGPDTLKELRESWAAVDDAIHVNSFIDMHDLGDALMASGFAEPVMETDNIVINYQSVSELVRDLKGLGAGNVNQERRKTLTGKTKFKGMCAEYEKKTRSGLLPSTNEVIYGHAWLPGDFKRPAQKDFKISLDVLKSALNRITTGKK